MSPSQFRKMLRSLLKSRSSKKNVKQIHQMRYRLSRLDRQRTRLLMRTLLVRDPRQRHRKNFCKISPHRRRERSSHQSCQVQTKTKRKTMLKSLLRNQKLKKWCKKWNPPLTQPMTFQSSLWVRQRILLRTLTLLVKVHRLKQMTNCLWISPGLKNLQGNLQSYQNLTLVKTSRRIVQPTKVPLMLKWRKRRLRKLPKKSQQKS